MLLSLDGLHPPSRAVRVAFSAGWATRTDGPCAEAKEAVGGYWLLEVKSTEEAVEWAARCPGQDGDRREVRQLQDVADLPPEMLPPVSPERRKVAPQFPQ